jgi:hypothetical protein
MKGTHVWSVTGYLLIFSAASKCSTRTLPRFENSPNVEMKVKKFKLQQVEPGPCGETSSHPKPEPKALFVIQLSCDRWTVFAPVDYCNRGS